jgi:hypothetical protein
MFPSFPVITKPADDSFRESLRTRNLADRNEVSPAAHDGFFVNRDATALSRPDQLAVTRDAARPSLYPVTAQRRPACSCRYLRKRPSCWAVGEKLKSQPVKKAGGDESTTLTKRRWASCGESTLPSSDRRGGYIFTISVLFETSDRQALASGIGSDIGDVSSMRRQHNYLMLIAAIEQ